MIRVASWFFAPAAAAAAVVLADPGTATRNSQVLFAVVVAARIVAALRPGEGSRRVLQPPR
jgi:hypothetical protein